MIALKGHIKTIAIYPENGVRPYLRGMDGSVYVPDIEDVRNTDIYQETLESSNGMVWKSVPKNSGEIYLSSRTDKVVLYRVKVDMTTKKPLGFIVIGVSQERFQSLCESIVQSPEESVLVLDRYGNELSRYGELDEEVEAYLKNEEFAGQDYRTREKHLTYKDYDIICNQLEANASIVCKIVPRYGLQMQILDVAYMPLALLLGILLGMMPLLVIISNAVTGPLRKVSEAIQQFSTGDFNQQVEVTTSGSYLSTMFKQSLDCGFVDYLNQVRIERAWKDRKQ